MERCDVLIVGGGPAGSTCAWKLKEAGLDALVMDRAAFPRDKPCAGWITPQVFTELRLSPEEYAETGRTLQPIRGFRSGLLGSDLGETLFEKPISYGIRRCEFDAYLLERSGARVRSGTPATSFERTPAGWVVNGEIEAKLLVGAGGHFCPVARHLGARLGQEHAVTAQEIEVELDEDTARACDVDPAVPELSFCRDLKGYGWAFRKGRFLNVGLGREGDRGVPREVKRFFDRLKKDGRIPAGVEPSWKGHAYLLYGSSPRPLLFDRVLLIGDAAGLAFRESGEGIRTAVESGLLAAEVVVEARGDYRRERLEAYRVRVERRFGARANGGPPKKPGRLSRLLAPLLVPMPWFRRRFLLERWFLRAGDAPL